MRNPATMIQGASASLAGCTYYWRLITSAIWIWPISHSEMAVKAASNAGPCLHCHGHRCTYLCSILKLEMFIILLGNDGWQTMDTLQVLYDLQQENLLVNHSLPNKCKLQTDFLHNHTIISRGLIFYLNVLALVVLFTHATNGRIPPQS